MEVFDIVLVVISVVLLGIHWQGPNAVWGSATLALVIGIIVSLITGNWMWLGRIFWIAVISGTIWEWIYRLSNRKRRYYR